MNNVTLMGRMTKECELRFTNNGKLGIANITLAVENPYNKDKTNFINCVAFGKTAEIIADHVKKGDQIGVVGHIETGSYEKEGRTIYTTTVNIDRFTFGASKKVDSELKPSTNDD